jgi:exopolysaccharide biosynthesis polyprenyl glycosylphosphotransferase
MPLKLPKYKYILAISDFILIFFTGIISFILSGYKVSDNIIEFVYLHPLILFVSFIIAFVFVFIFQSNNLYKINVFLTYALQLAAIIKSLFYGSVSIIFFAFLFKYSFLLHSRKFIFVFLSLSILLMVIFRLVILRNLFIKFSKSIGVKRNVTIIGGGKSGKLLAAKLLFEESLGVNIVGFIDDNIPKGELVLDGLKSLGAISELENILIEKGIDEIIIAIDNISYERLLQILDVCNSSGVLVKLTSELFEVVPKKMDTEEYSGIPVINVSPQMDKRLFIIFKRVIDIVGAIVGLLFLSPVFLLVSILIKLSSKGPVFYTHDRIGYKGKPFKFYKFRSMRPVSDDDEERKKKMIEFMKKGRPQSASDTKIINEDRVTWIGKIIRKTSIDELPQLINVLKGDMSLVGPRPCLPYEYENYDEWQKRRLDVLPGCTGVWQVFGRSNVSFRESVVMDLYYINNMSPWLDLQLIFKTIPVMLFSKGGK